MSLDVTTNRKVLTYNGKPIVTETEQFGLALDIVTLPIGGPAVKGGGTVLGSGAIKTAKGVRAVAGATGTRLGITAKVTSVGRFFEKVPVTFKATKSTGTKQTYQVYKRKDIDWAKVRTSGPIKYRGKTNAEAAEGGYAPQLSDGSFATLHHLGQKAPGPLAEASTRYHGIGKYGQDTLHSQYGRSKPHPTLPIDRPKFNVDTREYWKWRIKNR